MSIVPFKRNYLNMIALKPKNIKPEKPPARPIFPEKIDTGSIDNDIGYRIRMANVHIFKNFKKLIGMTPQKYAVLGLIAHNEGLPQVALGRTLNMDKATTMAIIDKLEQSGLIVRKTSTVDRRYQAIFMTPNGKKKQRVFETDVQAFEDHLSSKFTKSELADFLGYLSRCTED